MFTGEHPGPVRFHSEGPTGRGTAVQVGPRDDGPAHMAEGVFLREGWRARGIRLLKDIWWISSWVILWGVVLLRKRRLEMIKKTVWTLKHKLEHTNNWLTSFLGLCSQVKPIHNWLSQTAPCL